LVKRHKGKKRGGGDQKREGGRRTCKREVQ